MSAEPSPTGVIATSSNMVLSADTRLATTRRAIVASIVAIFASFSVIGILRVFSPIPAYDIWEGYLGFYADLLDGKYSAWFAQFVGHRPILPRVLFWLDIRYFRGRFVSVIAANLIMLCGVIAILMTYLRRLTNEQGVQFVIGATICIAAVSWLQVTNLVDAHSGANWFMAMLLPLVAFYWLARAKEQQLFFWLALLAGFASAWTLANGILVLPLLATLALCIRFKPAKIAMLSIAGVLTIALYFDFFSNEQSSVFEAYWAALRGDPVGAVQHVLGFLGSPFFYMVSYPLAMLQYLFQGVAAGQAPRPDFGGQLVSDYPIAFSVGLGVAGAAGAVLVLGATIVARRWFVSGREAIRGALLTFIFFIIITAVAIAAGRPGIENIFGSQYITAALLAWIGLIVLAAPSFNLDRALCTFVCAAIILFPSQMLPVFGLRRIAITHERTLQAMQAVLHGSEDAETLRILHSYDPDLVRRVVHRLRGTKISIFADGP
jgi:hypothetical protein